MLKNYFTITIRNLFKNRIFSLINILGLALGLSCSIIILLYVQDQLSYDRFYENADNIYRLNLDVKYPGGVSKYSTTSPPMGPALVQAYPEFKEAVRVRIGSAALIQYDEVKAYEEGILFVDSNFFNLFNFDLQQPFPARALAEPNTIVLTENSAKKYFGNKNPIGKILRMDNSFDLKVTNVIAPKKYNSHIKFDFLISFSTFPSTLPEGYDVNDWGWTSFFTYLRMDDKTDIKRAEAKIPGVIASHFSEQTAKRIALSLEPVTDVYFNTERTGDFGVVGNKSALFILGAVAIFSLIIACFNFINLSTARSAKRAKEVGLRKVLGAQKPQLIKQFIGESIIISFIAIIIAFFLVELFVVFISANLGLDISLHDISVHYIILSILTVPLLIGILAGSYPAFILSKFIPSIVLKGNFSAGSSGATLRRVLVVAQFIVSTVMIIGTFVIAEQMNYIKNKNLGFDKEQVLVIKLRGEEVISKFDNLKNALLRNTDITNVGGARNGLDGGFGSNSIFIPGENNSDETRFETYIYPVHYNFFKTLGMNFVSGRSFSEDFASDQDNSVILNEAAVKQFGLTDPVGKQIRLGRGPLRTIVGIVDDFNYASLRDKIAPLVFYISLDNAENMFVKLNAGDIYSTLNVIEQTWQEVLPNYPLEFSFLDERINNVYQSDIHLASLVNLFSGLAVIIACLGLFGLTSYIIEQRTKEIGIRKVLGASIPNVLFISSWQFLLLILIANLVAWPIAYYFMNLWLRDFAYRIDMNIRIFITSGGIAFLIAIGTISFQAVKAALANPVESLKYE